MNFRHFLVCAAFSAGAAAANELPDLGDASQSTLSAAQERALGESIMRQIRSSPAYLDDAEVADYLNGIGQSLVANSPDPGGHFEFFAVADGSINAFALPGGFIGVHTGLVLGAQSESELASVLGHEIAHVTQKHIARMLAAQQRSGLASMAALAVAILAARSNAQLSQAAIATAQAAAIQTQLNYSRDHEREADRIGLQIVQASGFDAHAMPRFLERLQRSSRLYEGGAPSYLRTHPLTFERIADVQNRTQAIPFRQVPDGLEFHLIRARLTVLQSNPREAAESFRAQLRERKFANEAAARYGLVFALLQAGNGATATAELQRLEALAGTDALIMGLIAQAHIKRGAADQGLETYRRALVAGPARRALAYGYGAALIELGRAQQAVDFLARQVEKNPADPQLYELQARAYAQLGKKLLRHRAQAEAYALRGNLAAAIEQLHIARSAGDGDFYQQSSVEARLKELKELDAEARRRD
ncbi:MAG TPA: M48 family metalloprotease [Burkholderiales bacterium]|nr:M48 family metalloprotease [Burkholderiales bacterium]